MESLDHIYCRAYKTRTCHGHSKPYTSTLNPIEECPDWERPHLPSEKLGGRHYYGLRTKSCMSRIKARRQSFGLTLHGPVYPHCEVNGGLQYIVSCTEISSITKKVSMFLRMLPTQTQRSSCARAVKHQWDCQGLPSRLTWTQALARIY